MNYFLVLITFFLFSCKGNKQKETFTSQKTCNTEFLAHLNNDKNITDYEIFEFLESFSDQGCKNNVEYSEYSSEVLFLLLDNKTSVFLKKLDEISPQARAVVLQELSSPVIERDMPALAKKVGRTDGSPKTISEVIVALVKNASPE